MKASAIIIFFLVLALCHTSFSDDQANSTDDKTNEMDQDAKYHFWEDKWDGEVLRYLEEQGNETLGDAQARQQQLYRSIHVARVADASRMEPLVPQPEGAMAAPAEAAGQGRWSCR